ncbi:hypothetical protein BHE74_00029755, partial [Ensete ventricosum]
YGMLQQGVTCTGGNPEQVTELQTALLTDILFIFVLASGESLTDFDHNLYEYGSVRYNIQVLLPLHIIGLRDHVFLIPHNIRYCNGILILVALAYVVSIHRSFSLVLTLSIAVTRHRHQVHKLSTCPHGCHHFLHSSLQIVYLTVPYKMSKGGTGLQELVDVSNLEAHSKAPRCTWSPIPPPELRGEPFQYLTTNGGFVSLGGHKNVKKLMNFSRSKMFKKRYTTITNKIKKFHYRIRIKWLLHRFRRQWLRVQKIPLLRKYRKLD